MIKSVVPVIVALFVLGMLVSGCAPSTPPAEPSAMPSDTPSPIPPTFTPEPTITPTATEPPTPTPLPGVEVFPLDTLGSFKPWLPFDENRAAAVQGVFFNTQIPPFDNVLVRQAFAASIDRDVIIEMAEKWNAIDPSPATTFIPPAILGRDLSGVVGITFDPERAKDLFAQAGYTDASTFPVVTLIVNYYGDIAPGARFNMARAMAEMWHTHLGVTVNVETMQPQKFRETLRSNPPELFWNGWVDSDPSIIDIFRSDSEANYGGFSNPEVDSLIDRAGWSHDPAERQELYILLERILCESDPAVLPVYHHFLGS